MDGTGRAQTPARQISETSTGSISPNATIAALVLSTCVTALSAAIVVSHGLSVIGSTAGPDVAEAAEVIRPVQRPTSRVRPLSIPADPAVVALGFDDPAPALAAPERLSAGSVVAPARATQTAVVRIIEGRPPVLPPRRPTAEGPAAVQLASGLSIARALTLPVPAPRPEAFGGATSVRVASAQRPALRPATLSTRRPPADAIDGGASLVLARAVGPEADEHGAVRRPEPRITVGNPCRSRLAEEIPRRPSSAPGGAAVMAGLMGSGGSSRDSALVAEALRGNVPGHLRQLQPVTFSGLVGGRTTRITICVTPDYLAIGSDRDHVRVPMGLPAALRIADAFDMMLPTTRMVDAIYAQADLRLRPRPMTPGAQMTSTDYFLRHDRTLDAQMVSAGGHDGLLIAGHKKDIVLANRLARNPGRVAIYGWHRSGGDPIQPLSTVHGARYADYSHGVRLVSRTAFVDGREMDLRGLLTDGRYASLLNRDGPLSGATVRLASLQ